MRDTIQLLLFDPTVPEGGPKLAETISFEDAVRRAQTGAKRSDRVAAHSTQGDARDESNGNASRAVVMFPLGHALPEATTKSGSAEVITLRAHRDYQYTGPKAA
jgi:hypothetical protein